MAPDVPLPAPDDGGRRSCPICGRLARDAAAAPFCSKRCADVDLHRWLGGVYAVPAEEGEAPEAADDEA